MRGVWQRIVRGAAIAVALFAQPAVAQSDFDETAFVEWADAEFTDAYRDDKAFSGMGLAIVRPDQPAQFRTYGYARGDSRTAIDPEKTRFLIGSLTKTFVGIAIAQLVESGQIESIDDRANKYLKRYKLPGRRGNDVTIRHLLTHSAGIGFTNRGVGTTTPGGDMLDADAVAKKITGIVREPGTLTSYSNVTTGVLGILVEDVTGTDIEDYFRAEIWEPLGLTSARFHREGALSSDNAIAGTGVGKDWEPRYFIAFDRFYYPVGAIEITLADAARYARFHLAGALGEETPILSAGAMRQLQSIQHPVGDGMGGFGFQLMNFPWGPHRVIGHGGSWPGYDSMLLVLPDRETALFYSIAGPKGFSNMEANRRILSRIYGPSAAPGPVQKRSADSLSDYTGHYAFTMHPDEGVERIFTLLSPQSLEVRASEGGLMFGNSGPFYSVGKDRFWSADAEISAENIFGSNLFAFQRDENGKVVALVQQQGLGPLVRVPAWRDRATLVNALMIVAMGLLVGLAAIFWPWRGASPRWPVRASAIVAGPAILAIAPLIGLGHGPGGPEAYIIEGHSGRWIAASLLAHLAALGGIILVASAVWQAIRKPEPAYPAWVRWHHVLLGILGAILAALLLLLDVLFF